MTLAADPFSFESELHGKPMQIALANLQWKDVADIALDPDKTKQLPAVDVYFLDALYHLAFNTGVPEHALARTCPACAHKFIPVAEMIWEHAPP
mgnify:CR=1 FL=1